MLRDLAYTNNCFSILDPLVLAVDVRKGNIEDESHILSLVQRLLESINFNCSLLKIQKTRGVYVIACSTLVSCSEKWFCYPKDFFLEWFDTEFVPAVHFQLLFPNLSPQASNIAFE